MGRLGLCNRPHAPLRLIAGTSQQATLCWRLSAGPHSACPRPFGPSRPSRQPTRLQCSARRCPLAENGRPHSAARRSHCCRSHCPREPPPLGPTSCSLPRRSPRNASSRPHRRPPRPAAQRPQVQSASTAVSGSFKKLGASLSSLTGRRGSGGAGEGGPGEHTPQVGGGGAVAAAAANALECGGVCVRFCCCFCCGYVGVVWVFVGQGHAAEDVVCGAGAVCVGRAAWGWPLPLKDCPARLLRTPAPACRQFVQDGGDGYEPPAGQPPYAPPADVGGMRNPAAAGAPLPAPAPGAVWAVWAVWVVGSGLSPLQPPCSVGEATPQRVHVPACACRRVLAPAAEGAAEACRAGDQLPPYAPCACPCSGRAGARGGGAPGALRGGGGGAAAGGRPQVHAGRCRVQAALIGGPDWGETNAIAAFLSGPNPAGPPVQALSLPAAGAVRRLVL